MNRFIADLADGGAMAGETCNAPANLSDYERNLNYFADRTTKSEAGSTLNPPCTTEFSTGPITADWEAVLRDNAGYVGRFPRL